MKSLRRLLFESDSSDEEKPFGDILFGDARNLPEKDIQPEKNLSRGLADHYSGEKSHSAIDTLDKLEKQGLYTDILSVPKEYQYAYRVLTNLSAREVNKFIGGSIEDILNVERREVQEISGNFTYEPQSKNHSSWTASIDGLRYISTWTNAHMDTYIVILKAPIHSGGNRFIMNPDVTPELEFVSGEYEWEKEVISIGNVSCSKLWYMRSAGSAQHIFSHVEKVES